MTIISSNQLNWSTLLCKCPSIIPFWNWGTLLCTLVTMTMLSTYSSTYLHSLDKFSTLIFPAEVIQPSRSVLCRPLYVREFSFHFSLLRRYISIRAITLQWSAVVFSHMFPLWQEDRGVLRRLHCRRQHYRSCYNHYHYLHYLHYHLHSKPYARRYAHYH